MLYVSYTCVVLGMLSTVTIMTGQLLLPTVDCMYWLKS